MRRGAVVARLGAYLDVVGPLDAREALAAGDHEAGRAAVLSRQRLVVRLDGEQGGARVGDGERDAEVVGGHLHPCGLGRRAGAVQQLGDGDAAPADARHRPALEAGEVVDHELLGHGEQAIEVNVERLADEAVDAQAPRRWVGRIAGVDRQCIEDGQFG